jgi:hypothetical protein
MLAPVLRYKFKLDTLIAEDVILVKKFGTFSTLRKNKLLPDEQFLFEDCGKEKVVHAVARIERI